MGASFEKITTALTQAGRTVKGDSRQVTAQCPAHDDHNPSLSVTDHPNGALIHCHAGCETEDVLGELGLTKRDLYDDPKGPRYDYFSADRETVLRSVYRSPDKNFRQQVNRKDQVPLFQLPEVMQAVREHRPIILVEGEKDALTASRMGYTGTTAPMGASNFHKVDITPLAGATVIAVVDKDEAGDKWAAEVQARLQGVATSVKFRQAATGKDLSDHYAAGGTLTNLANYEVKQSTPDGVHEQEDGRQLIYDGNDKTGSFLVATPASIVRTEKVWFFYEHLIPMKVITLFSGLGGEGKTTLLIHFAAKGTVGTLPGKFFGQPVDIVVTGTEDTQSLLKLRLQAAGADLDRVTFLNSGRIDESGIVDQSIIIPRDIEKMRKFLRYKNAKLWIIDPITAVIEGDVNAKHVVRAALDPLNRLAQSENIAIAAIAHFNKGGGRAAVKVANSMAFRDAVRAHIPMAKNSAGETVYTLEKANYSKHVGKSWKFILEDTTQISDDGEEVEIARVKELGESEESVETLINQSLDSDDDMERIPVDEWLEENLTQSGGEARASDIFRAGEEEGYSKRSIQRARNKLGITSKREGFKGGSMWVLSIRANGDKKHGTNESVTNERTAPNQQKTDKDTFIRASAPRGTNELKTVTTKDTNPPLVHPKYGVLVYAGNQLVVQDPDLAQEWRNDGQPDLLPAEHGKDNHLFQDRDCSCGKAIRREPGLPERSLCDSCAKKEARK